GWKAGISRSGPDRTGHSRPGLPWMIALWVMTILAAFDGNRQAWAQEPVPKSTEQPGDDQALSLHYRFIERYSAQEDPSKPEALTQYRVGSRDTLTSVR